MDILNLDSEFHGSQNKILGFSTESWGLGEIHIYM